MDDGERLLLRRLLVERPLMALGVLVEGAPYVGQVPCALTAEGALLVHVSRLAKHARGLSPGARWSGLLQLADGGHADPFQCPRLTLEGGVESLAPSDPRHDQARATYLTRLPSGAVTFQLGDFTLYELTVERGRLVAGFGRTLNLTAQHLREAAALAADG